MEEKEKVEELEEEPTKKVEKKGHPLLVTLLIIVLLIVFFGFGYAMGGTNTVKDVTEQNNTKENEAKESGDETVSFSESELEKYVNYISPVSIGPSAKLYKADKVVASELSSKEKIEYVGHSIFERQKTTADASEALVSEEDVKKVIEEIYGPSTYERTTFNLGCGDYKFNSNDNYYHTQTGCGGATDKIEKNVVIDYKATKNKLEITTAYAFTDSSRHIYKDYDYKTKLEDSISASDNNEVVSNLTKYIKDNKDKLNNIVYTFESSDGKNYYFKELKNISK